MTKDEVVAAIEPRHNGSFARIQYEKIISTGLSKVKKITTATLRVKFSYVAMKAVAKSSGTTKLPDWKAWDAEHKFLLNYVGDKTAKKGTVYLRTGLTGCPTHVKKTEYVVLNTDLTAEQQQIAINTAKAVDRDNLEVIRDIDIKNIIQIGK